MTVLEYPYEYPEEGGFSGFLCAVFEAYRLKLENPAFHCLSGGSSRVQEFFEEAVPVPFSESRAGRVASGIRNRGGEGTWTTVVRAYLSDTDGREAFLYGFIRRIMAGGGAETLDRLDIPESVKVRRAAGRTANEAHRFLGILRFVQHSGLYYAPIEPDCRILPLIASHFRTRFADQRWVIHDVRRREALFWDRSVLSFETGVTADPPEDEDSFYEGLWKTYFSAAAIGQRRNLSLQQRFVPLKYRSHMTEMEWLRDHPWD